MVRAVYERYLHVYDLIAGEHARLHCTLDTLINAGIYSLGIARRAILLINSLSPCRTSLLNSFCHAKGFTARLTGTTVIDGRLADGLPL